MCHVEHITHAMRNQGLLCVVTPHVLLSFYLDGVHLLPMVSSGVGLANQQFAWLSRDSACRDHCLSLNCSVVEDATFVGLKSSVVAACIYNHLLVLYITSTVVPRTANSSDTVLFA